VITLTLNEAATVVACIEQYGKDAVPHVKAYFVAKERQDKAERDRLLEYVESYNERAI
jgi:hypothetical protein